MIKLYILIITTLISLSSFSQMALSGKWKPIKATFINYINTKTPTEVYNITSKTGKKSLPKNYDSTKLTLNPDSTFDMASYGLIVSLSEPGWNFGNTLDGKWAITASNNLILTIGDNKISHSFFYKILRYSIDRLILGQTAEEDERIFFKIEFVRL